MTPGYHVIPMERYLADPCVVPSLSASVAVTLLRESARKAWFRHPRLNPAYAQREETKFDLGTATHAMLLEGSNVIEVCEFDDWRTKDARARRDAARLAGRVPLLRKHHDDVMAMVSVATDFISRSEIADYWNDSEAELTGIALDQDVWLRCRWDRITKNRRIGIHYKTTEDVSPEVFSRQITRMGYDVTCAFYRRVASLLGVTGHRTVFFAQSIEPPYECSLHACDPALQEVSEAEVERAIHLWRVCSKSKSWPSYGGRIHYALPSTWQLQQHESRMLERAEA